MALFLVEEGFNQSQIERLAGIPRRTVSDWIRLGPPGLRPSRRQTRQIDPGDVPPRAYAYLLGLYLGDGYICRTGRTWRLRIAMDSRYPGIIEEARCAIAAVLAPNRASVQHIRNQNSVEVYGFSISLPQLFPQHGPGRKHTRRIVLEPWQEEIVDRHPELFLRGLIHSDGCRVTNRVWKGKYAYPRYFFSQVSTDIMELFCRTCRRLGIEYTLNKPTSLSVARRESVALVDGFVGPKA